jgi:hypothetical protein
VTGNHGPADSASNRDSQIKAIIKVAHNLIPYDGAVAAFYEGIVRPLLSKRGFDFAQSVLDAIFPIRQTRRRLRKSSRTRKSQPSSPKRRRKQRSRRVATSSGLFAMRP